MTERYVINSNGEIENTSNHMTWDSFTEVLTILNGQSRHLEKLGEENEQLKKELFETRKDYILETYADNPVRRDEKLKALKKEYMAMSGNLCDACKHEEADNTNNWFVGIDYDVKCNKGHEILLDDEEQKCEDFELRLEGWND